ncbi:hypothetical protein AA11826_0104 [Komagataeibacter oboediens DSM 11826]|uniref:hypothetical protein n=1 Tax=Komagataeibacter oboediens TaxID=65958 RepID=UPI0015E89C73|nr:hypothetical protein [Komagataeibacter oboediens]GBR27583.1 hypothetical protein AA11826_0104 [Komagataeibacter oboediens DSM 11826]
MTQGLTKETKRILNTVVTPERQKRSEWTVQQGAPRVRSTVQALLNAGDIDQDAADAADRWYRDFVFGYYGYVEFAPQHEINTLTRHDKVSWMIVRAHAKARITDIRDALGMCAHVRLRMMIAEEKTFSDMGKVLYPGTTDSVGRRKVSAQCALVLEQLSDYHERQDKKRLQPESAIRMNITTIE